MAVVNDRPPIEQVTQVASPVLAGFSITLVGLLVTAGMEVRLAGPALLLAVISAVSQLIAIQCGAWAGHFHAQRTSDLDSVTKANEAAYAGHVRRAQFLYGTGVITLLVSVGLAIFPDDETKGAAWRWAAVFFIVGVAILQLAWGGLVNLSRRNPAGRLGWFNRRFMYRDRE